MHTKDTIKSLGDLWKQQKLQNFFQTKKTSTLGKTSLEWQSYGLKWRRGLVWVLWINTSVASPRPTNSLHRSVKSLRGATWKSSGPFGKRCCALWGTPRIGSVIFFLSKKFLLNQGWQYQSTWNLDLTLRPKFHFSLHWKILNTSPLQEKSERQKHFSLDKLGIRNLKWRMINPFWFF